MKVKYLILGAGPAGLTVANMLKRKGISDFAVIEAEKEVGGLCRSKNVGGSPLDIGGGHFLDVKRPEVNDFLFSFMPEKEWNKFERDSKISIDGNLINHPIEANIWQFPIEKQVEYLKAIATAGCNTGKDIPVKFIEWIYWKLGDKIAEDYMLPYNKKMFGENLDLLGTYWLEKLPNVSFEDTLRSCLEKKMYGTQPGHAHFYYPKKYGYGELWKRMGDELEDKLIVNARVFSLEADTQTVTLEDGRTIQADYIITTIPWNAYSINVCDEVSNAIKSLKNTSVVIRYDERNINTKAQWIYYPEPELEYHRILVRSNFCPNSRGHWTETNRDRITIDKNEINKTCFINEYAYPLNTVQKPKAMEVIKKWAMDNKIIPLGRWGEHEHFNSDVTVERAMDLSNKLC